jgi:hypothetical protein
MRYHDTYQDILFYKDEMIFNGQHPHQYRLELVEFKDYDGPVNSSFLEDEQKFFIHLHPSFFHLLLEDFGSILSMMKKYPGRHFILSVTDMLMDNESLKAMLDLLLEVLKENQVKHSVISTTHQGPIRINLFYYHPSRFMDKEGVDAICGVFGKKFNTVSIPAEKKVYLSRSKVMEKNPEGLFMGQPLDKFSFTDDIRLYNEDLLVDFFSSCGFDIVVPEDFKTFEEQIKFFSSVKTLVSTTGAGLSNMVFMKPGTTVIELTTSLIAAGREDVHTHYQSLAYAMDQTYISLPVMRNSYKALEIIKKSEGLMKIVNE